MNNVTIPHLTAQERQAVEVFITCLHERFPGRIHQAIPFRSKARGDSQPWSDIDILAILDEKDWPTRQEINTLAARVSLEYDVLIGSRVIGQERWERMKQRRFSLYQNIVAEGIALTPTPAHP
jgi:predicted nucleotidyltransferase